MIGKNNSLAYLNVPVLVKKIHPNAKLPTQSEGDVGFDIFCVENITLKAGKVTHVPIGLVLAETPQPLILENKVVSVPFLKVEGRSGLASDGIFPVGGVIDPKYRGEIGCLLYNSTDKDFEFIVGDKVAQFVIVYTLSCSGSSTSVKFLETEKVSESDRGAKGFGSSGR